MCILTINRIMAPKKKSRKDATDGLNVFGDLDANIKSSYPQRLMVDFTQLNLVTLKKYLEFNDISFQDTAPQDMLASLVARHFDHQLANVNEDESICSFVRRVRMGEATLSSSAFYGHTSTRRSREARPSSNNMNEPSKRKPRKTAAASRRRQREGGYTEEEEEESMTSTNNPAHQMMMMEDEEELGDEDEFGRDDSGDIKLYCICNRPSFGDMIACDAENCAQPSQWYHLECVGLLPGNHPDTWHCPNCTGRRNNIS